MRDLLVMGKWEIWVGGVFTFEMTGLQEWLKVTLPQRPAWPALDFSSLVSQGLASGILVALLCFWFIPLTGLQ